MASSQPMLDEDEAKAQALAESDADPRTVPHERVRAWLMRLAKGEFDAPLPEPDYTNGPGH